MEVYNKANNNEKTTLNTKTEIKKDTSRKQYLQILNISLKENLSKNSSNFCRLINFPLIISAHWHCSKVVILFPLFINADQKNNRIIIITFSPALNQKNCALLLIPLNNSQSFWHVLHGFTFVIKFVENICNFDFTNKT